MDTSTEFQEVLRKQKAGIPVSYREVAVIIANDEHSFLQFLADNDFPQVYRLLHHEPDSQLVVGETAKFSPDKKRVEGELRLLLDKKDNQTINSVIDKFVFNPNTRNVTSNAKVLECLRDIEAIKATPEGNVFNVRF